ncbi:transposable element Tcb2 transposase [Trichonephila clavipes]|nr:transposable element Tcb2 transposase [Trichonephila clavipes]
MARINHLDDFTRGRMIEKLEEGHTVTCVAAEFGINKSVVSRDWKAFQTTGIAVRKVGGGRPRTSTAGGMTYISFCRRKEADTSHQAPLFSISLQQRGDNGAEGTKTGQLINGVVSSTDECRFSTRSYSQRVLIWREIGTRFYPSNIKERHRYAGPGVLVWGGIMLNGYTELHIFDRGSVTGDRYCEEVLLPHVRLFRGAIGPDFIFMDDNARQHRTFAVEELLESEDITRMDWPAYSPDLNPLEYVWDALGRRIAARLHHPENTQRFKQMLIEEWAPLPQEMFHQLVLSMRRRCEATIAVRGEGSHDTMRLIKLVFV